MILFTVCVDFCDSCSRQRPCGSPWSGLLPGAMLIFQEVCSTPFTGYGTWENWPYPLPRQRGKAGPKGVQAGELPPPLTSFRTLESRFSSSPGQLSRALPSGGSVDELAQSSWAQERWLHLLPEHHGIAGTKGVTAGEQILPLKEGCSTWDTYLTQTAQQS